MSVFVQDGKVKSITLLMGFCLSFLFVVVFVLAYMFTADLVAANVPETSESFWDIWLPPVLISLGASVLCCALMFLFKSKMIVPVGFGFLAVYYVIFLITILFGAGGENAWFLERAVRIYMLPPVIIGNLLSWGSYLIYFRKKR